MADLPGQITISCSNHHDKLIGGLWNFFRSSHSCDFDMRWGGRSIRAHRLILDVFLSPDKLDQWTSQRDVNNDHDHMDSVKVETGFETYLPDTNYLDSLLEFLYRGRITVSEESLEQLLELATELDLRMLVDAIDAARNDAASPSNQKRRRRKGIPIKIFNSDPANKVDDDDNDKQLTTSDSDDDESYDRMASASKSRQDSAVQGVIKRGRGRPKGSRNKTKTVRRRKRKTSTGSESGSDASAAGDLEDEGENVPAKLKRKRHGERVVPPRQEGDPPRSKAEYKRLWQQRQPLMRCEHCPYETRWKRSYLVHMAQHDSSAVLFRCDECSKPFLNEDSFERHKIIHQAARTIHTCHLCPYTTNKVRYLKAHVVNFHKMTTNGVPLAKTYKCAQCDYSFVFASQLANHLLTHQPERQFKCELCSYASIRKYELDKHHQIVHLNQRLFLCVECGHKSATSVHLKSHMRTHTGERPFVCPQCGKAYSSKGKLNLHVRRHQSNEKPYICDLCGFSAYRRDNLQMHMKRIHKTTLMK